ncbi:hypothetical protein BLOT_005230 [Blomia tropicalis]|nr:hypothetical protein BLOT_005230 [Blomia tropicalis]
MAADMTTKQIASVEIVSETEFLKEYHTSMKTSSNQNEKIDLQTTSNKEKSDPSFTINSSNLETLISFLLHEA